MIEFLLGTQCLEGCACAGDIVTKASMSI